MIIYIGEAIGTFIFVFLSFAIIANAITSSGNSNVTLLITSLGVGLAYIIPCIVFGEITGAHFNPAVTISTAYFDIFEKRFMIGYIISEAVGALLASIIFIIIYYNKILQLEIDKNEHVRVFSNDGNIFVSFLKEVFATFFLMFGMLGVSFIAKEMALSETYIFFFLIIVGIGLAFDYTKVATNPFRDIFIRIIYLMLPFRKKERIKFVYALIAIIGPVVGAMLAVLFYKLIPFDA